MTLIHSYCPAVIRS